MTKSIFRKDALNRLASPERTDAAIRLVGPSGWLILFAVLFAMAAALVWAFATTAPIKVRAQGIFIDQAGLVELASEQGGLLESVTLLTGTVIEKGAVVATLSRAELERDLKGAEAELVDRRERYDQIAQAQESRGEREAFVDGMRIQTIEQTRAALKEREALLAERAKNLEPLVQRKTVPQLRLIEARIAVSDVQERLMALDEDLATIALGEAERTSERAFELLEERLAIDEIVRRIERLKARLAEEQVIRSPYRGRVVEVKVNAGDVLAPGAALATLTPEGAERNLQALIYVPPADGKRVEPGMRAEISPTTVEAEVFGHIAGTVLSVAPLPATPEGMRRVLQNDQLVEQLSLGGAPIEVRVDLERDAGTATGFAWSVSEGPVGGVGAGTLLDGKLVVASRPLPDLVFPGLVSTVRRWFGTDGT